ncbi:endonuclease [Rhodococcus sp. Leaf7]|uniref:DNA/RNA non-specific endonuclease n=1 Tax=unclassified Rhodococcus (in: high G+C Gram-positive bacteria) TaxID=192944 RepID=UPI0006F2CDE1|nr:MULTISPECIES: DNA/RNA non-specific endonuclease [unclassified Rhodococcus (in: high G+C Gram-positive bacteria)]KQU04567.1 endonuclease [Rhodococcus sp. Leaf7]KQU40753.1 endonuclease [Rhodococcus sp. Leaf247]
MGYDEVFLSATALPIPTRPALTTLTYTHFSVSMDISRRLAAVTAVNIDGAALRDVERGDDWRLDPRLPTTQQAGPELYANNDIDRGHLVRRRDPVWGTRDVAEQANEDTFHYTVCGPQTATLNQSKELWLGLEDYVLEHARTYGQKISVFSGCIFADDDPVYRGIAIPRRFFKIATWWQDDVPAATGYVLDQSESLAPILERGVLARDIPPLGAYRTYQVPVADIAAATGLAMADLTAADRLALVPGVRPVEWREIERADDLVW